ncbi:MAG: KH domain-containing protein [Clostridia bacterium]|nr:KH domain-containing protein [Clostridia bacterium]
MKELLEFIAKSMVSDPEAVSVEEETRENMIVLTLHVGENDMGKVIGKQGRIVKAIRTVVKAAASHENKKVMVDIV